MDKENDLFSEIVKEKLTNYTLPVDDDSWDKIAERLNPASRKITQRRWIAALAAAASIALLFMLFTITKKTVHHETAIQLSDHEKTIIQDVSEEEIVQPVLSQNVESSASFRKSQPFERLPENSFTTEVISKEEIAEEKPVVSPKEEQNTPGKRPVSVDPYVNSGNEMQMPSIKHKKRQSIRLSFGSGGNLLAENNNLLAEKNVKQESSNPDLLCFRAATQTTNESRTKDILLYEDYPDITHHLPLSFGVTVKKELNRTFAIESGIVYSYVATSFNRVEPYPKSKANLQLHYIGIPLNLHTRFIGNRFSRWEMYLSAGGMVEKGVLSHFTQKTYYDDINKTVREVVSDEKIKGLQWSMAVSLGIDYQIYKNYSIYFEPKLNYYFDNDQPVSARTKHPVVVGLNAGIRLGW